MFCIALTITGLALLVGKESLAVSFTATASLAASSASLNVLGCFENTKALIEGFNPLQTKTTVQYQLSSIDYTTRIMSVT